MKFKKILNKISELESSLDDAFYTLPEYNANTDSRDYIDSARSELYDLKDEVEKAELKEHNDGDISNDELYNIEIDGC